MKMGMRMSKQYILLCEESGMEMLSKVFKSDVLQFLEVQGMSVDSSIPVSVLVTPIAEQMVAEQVIEEASDV